MSSKEKHEKIVNSISNILRKEGFNEIELEKDIGVKLLVDVLAISPLKVIVAEIKTGYRTGSSDVIALRSLITRLKASKKLEGKEIKGIIISPGTLDPARGLSEKLGITLIESEKTEEIETKIKNILQRTTRVEALREPT
jgi:RecB family endonuclease NucS